MADGNGTQDGNSESTAPSTEATFTREDLDRIADERAQAALDAYRQEQEDAQTRRDEELAATRARLHEMTVRERVAELEAAGHAPAVVNVAREIMLADVRQETALSLTRDGEELSLSATDIVTEILGAIPETALTRTEIPVGNGNGDSETVEARADRLSSFLKGE